ncbi:HAMP domain-containing sensor histidine kinase [Catenulispora pinisilvae]|uniref:HAMP domain-containing sensor histidine kinase n=1 Tax=Catenulispora pinisilvae TaxID=2705253 RepID=UPI00189232FA|nr:HAMP domain-containing sensor histidine kinase [Catenulispora pinisilvae]
MTRRIALAFAALVAVLLVAAVLPLGAAMQSREEESFRFATISAARQVSAAAEETLVDHHPPDAMNEAVAAAERDGDCVGVFAGTGALVTATKCGTAKDSAAIAIATRTLSGKSEITARSGDWLRAAVPVGDEDDSGAVVLARSAESLDHRVDVMWGWLALTAVACLALGVALAFALARWVSRPLLALDTTAARLGDGALDVRAPTEGGPPEVRRLARTFNRMAERTETLVHAHRGWVADVSHQLRTPLTALRLRLDVLAGEAAEAAAEQQAVAEQQAAAVDPESAVAAASSQSPDTSPGSDFAAASNQSPVTSPGSDFVAAPSQSPAPWPGSDFAAELAGVQEEIERLSRLVDGLLAVARAEAVVARRVAVPVAEVAAERVSAWEPVAREHGQQLIAPAASRAAAWLAPGDLEQILDNVIANALAAVPTGGHVRVDAVADRERDRVVLRVIDDGPGMSDAAKQSAFRRFGASSGAGSGLGLAIVDRLVTANGGEVRLADTVGGGLTVVVELPAASSAGPSDR